MKMANMDAILDFMFTQPKRVDNVSESPKFVMDNSVLPSYIEVQWL